MPSRSVRQKLVVMIMSVTIPALLAAIVAMVAYDLALYHRSWIADLKTQAQLLAQTSAPALIFNDDRSARENLALLRYRPQVHAAAIYDARGKLLASFSREGAGPLPELPEADGARVTGNELVVFKRIVNNREILGTVYIRAEYALFARLLTYLEIALLVIAGAGLMAYVLSRYVQRTVSAPLAAIAGVAREVTEKRNFSLRAARLSDDEVGSLAESFNTMLAEIEHSTRDLSASNEEVLRLNAELERRVSERTSQLEYTNRELEAFCYSVSHDLRAPLRSIDGFSQALIEDFPTSVPQEARGYLQRIRAATQRMAQLIEDLLNLSRVSRAELQRQEVDVSALARQVLAELQQREPQRKVEASVWDDLRAQADPRLLRAALENLIGNAWKFTGAASSPRIEIGALADRGEATFFIRDNGAGFDMAYADKLFGAFQRLHSANEFSGTGIGLATVQRIVSRHGGRIWADAKPGKGAVFFFTLAATQ